jgi:anaerobic magnesium-protoporphyrin IX monomethyl ester cyclase
MKILLVAYDNGSYIGWFPQGLAYITACLERVGYDVTLYLQDIHHYPPEHLTQYLNKNHFDVIGVGVIAGYYQYQQLKKISKAINRSDDRPFFVLGGHGPSPEPGYFLKITNADAVVIGEGEETMLDLISSIENDKPLDKVKGIAFQDITGNTTVTAARKLIQDLDTLPFPAYEKFPIEIYRLGSYPGMRRTEFSMPILSGRGCTFRCNFCYRLDKGHRSRSNESILDEIRFLQSRYGVSYIVFSDELLMISKERTISLCEDIIRSGLKFKWNCNGRLNYATDEVVSLMKKAGCSYINYGIEAVDNDVLKRMKKGLRVSMINKGIDATLKAGIHPGFNIIFGHKGDNKDTISKAVELLLKYNDHSELRTIRPVTPYPGSPLYYEAIEKGLLKGCEDFYENKHINSDLLSVNFTDLEDDEYYSELASANKRLISSYYRHQLNAGLKQVDDLYKDKDAKFRGFRQY